MRDSSPIFTMPLLGNDVFFGINTDLRIDPNSTPYTGRTGFE